MYGAPAASIPGSPPNAIVNGDLRVSQCRPVASTNVATDASTGLVTAPVFTESFGPDCSFLQGRWSVGNFAPTFNGVAADHPLYGARGTSRKWTQSIAVGGTPGAAAQINFVARMEGWNLAPFLDRSDAELSFWAKSSMAGTHYVVINGRLSDFTLWQFVIPYSITTANTWQQIIKPVLLPNANFPQALPDSTGTAVGGEIMFPLYSGTSQKCTTAQLSTWVHSAASGGDFNAGPDFVNFELGQSFQYTDLQLSFSGAWKRFPRIPFQQQLLQCQRYLWHTLGYGNTPVAGGNKNGGLTYWTHNAGVRFDGVQVTYPVPMRIAPQLSAYNPINAGNAWYNRYTAANSGTVDFSEGQSQSAFGCFVGNPQVAGDLANQTVRIHISADATLVT